jgi:hypothetical protein
MNKKDIQKLITKTFLTEIETVYGCISDEGESGTIDFTIDETDSSGKPFIFNYRRSYGDVMTWKMSNEKDYNRAYDLECEMQGILSKITTQIKEQHGK